MSYYHIIDIDEDGNPITKEYSNQIEYEIELWISDNAATIYDEETIKYILSIRQEIIDGLLNDDSVVDKSRIDIIKFLEEKYLMSATQTFVENNVATSFPIPKIIKGFKLFKYKSNKKKNKGESDKNTGGRPEEPDKKVKKKQLRSDYYDLTSKKGYKISKALDILEEKYAPWKRSTIETYLKK